MEFNPYRRYAMMITVEMITDDYTAVYTIFSEAVNRSQVFIERKIMNLEKKYRIIKISFILVSCLFFIVLYAPMSVNARKSIDSQKVFVEPIPVPIALRISVWMMRISFIIYLVIVYLMVHIKSLMNRFSSCYPGI